MVWRLLLLLALLPGAALADGEFAPEPSPPPAGFRGDFGLVYGITDGQGMSDHATLNLTLGVQVGDATPRKAPAVAPVWTGAGDVIEALGRAGPGAGAGGDTGRSMCAQGAAEDE